MKSIITLAYEQTINTMGRRDTPETTALLNQIDAELEQNMPSDRAAKLYSLVLEACGNHAEVSFAEGFKHGFQFAEEVK